MDAGVSSARQARLKHRHELRTLTYVTLDQANGGIVRNLTHEGLAAQVVGAVRPQQQLRVRFELRYPRLRLETRGEVVWATTSGRCGIRFLDVSPGLTRQINEWIFGNLLEGISLHADHSGPIFAASVLRTSRADESENDPSSLVAEDVHEGEECSDEECSDEEDGLIVSATPLKVIELPMRRPAPEPVLSYREVPHFADPSFIEPSPIDSSPFDRTSVDSSRIDLSPTALDWLSQPLSGRGLAWTIDTLAVVSGLLLCTLVFLSVTGEAPPWPLAMTGGAALLVAVMYWGFFKMFGGCSLGERLARLAGCDEAGEEDSARFR
jgi:PilZ domain-containing protein